MSFFEEFLPLIEQEYYKVRQFHEHSKKTVANFGPDELTQLARNLLFLITLAKQPNK